MTDHAWSDRFLGMLEALRMPTQFQRGRRYARDGRVRQLTISSSLASAVVLDEDGHSYRTKVAVRAFSGADWHRIERLLAERSVYIAKLLSGQFPEDIDRLLADLGLSLLPEELDELAMECACPDWKVPCPHLAATCYALARSFDEDPFGMLAWRGRSREELLGLLRLRTVDRAGDRSFDESPQGAQRGFWVGGTRPPRLVETAVAGTVARRPDAILDQLGPLDLSAGRHQVVDLLRLAYPIIVSDTESGEGASGSAGSSG